MYKTYGNKLDFAFCVLIPKWLLFLSVLLHWFMISLFTHKKAVFRILYFWAK